MGRRAKSNSRHLAALMSIALGAAALTSLPVEQSQDVALATETNKVSLYLSAPFVQGSHVTGANSTTENFDSFTAGDFESDNCPETTAVGSLTRVLSCYISEAGVYAGASSESSDPTTGGTGTKFIATPFYPSTEHPTSDERSITFNFGSAVKYVGLWWSAGNDGNKVRFYDSSDRLVAELSSNDIMDLLGRTTPSPFPGPGTVTTQGGGTHPKGYYFGNPRLYANTTPTSAEASSGSAIFTYLNLFLTGDLGVTKMQVAGPGFEFDNVTVSTVEQTPQGTMVLVTEKTVPTITWAPTTSLSVTDSPSTPSALATSSVAGTMAYSVVNAGATGCSVNSSTGVITYSAIGDCVVRASFTPTNSATSFPATKDVTFNITRAPQTLTWAPATALLLTASPATPSALATTSGDGAITYAVNNAGATGCTVDSTTAVLTFTAAGDCVVRATAAQTATYAVATKDVTFRIAAEEVEEVVVPAAPYTGPVPTSLSPNCAPADVASVATLSGERLNLITAAEVAGKKVEILRSSANSLGLSFPALSPGTYDVTYISDSGRLTHQASLRVCTSATLPGQVIAGTPEVSGTKFFVSKRFANYRGDRGPVVARDLQAITTFIKANPGLKSVTCVGSTSGKPALASDPALAKARAENACRLIKSLVPGVTTRTLTNVGKGTGQFFRAVTIFGSGSKAN